MKLFLIPVLLISISSCTIKEKQIKQLALKTQASAKLTINYDSCKTTIQLNKQKQKPLWRSLSKSAKEKIFTCSVVETIVPAWIGTAWDFNGISETPQQGSIACGYFVTTVLRDAGLAIARVKLAQCASEQMITTLVQSKYISRFSNVALEDFIKAIKKDGYGLYIVGLDNHTGFIYNDGKDVYFIHSTFLGTRNVQKENAATNQILKQSKYKVLGKISNDEMVLERWIN
jgi:allophanate hydrolase subunit 1